MISQPPRIHLFQAYGIELEYMIVDKETLSVKPIADELIRSETGNYDSDLVRDSVTWSNELVLHVVELKASRPEQNLVAIAAALAENVKYVNSVLGQWNAMLMPTGAHPFMNPAEETRLWPHGDSRIYETYNRIFDCRGHGWSNVQSTHLNLPFYDDQEFARLHAAVRLILPILPALCASTPLLNGKFTGSFDTRLKYYKSNQNRIPSIAGKIIPEAVYSRRNYLQVIYDRIKADLAPFDPERILNPIWVNSRGAIARFDRGSLEIRVMDCQECAKADVAVVALVIETLKALVNGTFIDHEAQMKWKTETLANLLDVCMEAGSAAVIDQADYLKIFGLSQEKLVAIELWKAIVEKILSDRLQPWKSTLDVILSQGTLAERIVRDLRQDYSRERMLSVYRRLATCLANDEMYT
ncbi:MAG TPA: glutamate-cysteine ligase family protein [Cyclobacteriaceae bacterium]